MQKCLNQKSELTATDEYLLGELALSPLIEVPMQQWAFVFILSLQRTKAKVRISEELLVIGME